MARAGAAGVQAAGDAAVPAASAASGEKNGGKNFPTASLAGSACLRSSWSAGVSFRQTVSAATPRCAQIKTAAQTPRPSAARSTSARALWLLEHSDGAGPLKLQGWASFNYLDAPGC